MQVVLGSRFYPVGHFDGRQSVFVFSGATAKPMERRRWKGSAFRVERPPDLLFPFQDFSVSFHRWRIVTSLDASSTLVSSTHRGGETLGGAIKRPAEEVLSSVFEDNTDWDSSTTEWSTGGVNLDRVRGGAVLPSVGDKLWLFPMVLVLHLKKLGSVEPLLVNCRSPTFQSGFVRF
ncbi:hypothetical protein Bca4012_039252 [Brassica carinata]|uniref:Uncharacterized protein n=1 Tax=Brassica carinata TaxID=52824 RepID=A0A8X7W6A7_BRACI|nr:hypothetical protein Bca52824_007466 [Brassica carinata]